MCSNNFKQKGMAYYNYAGDHSGFLPPNDVIYNNSPYVMHIRDSGKFHNDGILYETKYIEWEQTFYCPSAFFGGNKLLMWPGAWMTYPNDYFTRSSYYSWFSRGEFGGVRNALLENVFNGSTAISGDNMYLPHHYH